MSFQDYNIVIKSGRSSGEIQTTCPKCSHTRKKKTDKCLSVNLDKNTWFCHHCSWSGALKPEKMEVKTYFKPTWKNQTELSEKAVKWFEGRGISQETLKLMKISEGLEFMPQVGKEVNTIQFNYFEDEVLVNTKFRDAQKNFKLVKDAEKIPYNVNCLKNPEFSQIFIVEGEMDVLTFIQSGIGCVISVPNGASVGTNRLDYFDRFIELLNAKQIIIATDNDSAGRSLRNDIADRFGRYRCQYVDWGEFKDANEVLMKVGINGIIGANVKEFEIGGSQGIEQHAEDVFDLYINGLDSGESIQDGVLDNKLRFVKGYITTITGIPGHGKSEYLDHIITNLLVKANWRGAYYSPENKPTKLHISKLIRKLSGKSWWGNNRIGQSEIHYYLQYLNEKIWFIKPPKGFKLEDILESVKELKLRKNIDFFVIDAWNKLEHNFEISETKYIGKSLDDIAIFCEEFNLHCFLVAHPTKISKDKNTGIFEVPNLYSIAGSANFNNKTDNGLTVYRKFDVENTDISWTEVHIQKVKFGHWGSVGMVEYDFDKDNLRYRKKGTIEEKGSMIIKEPTQLTNNLNFENEKVPF